ncbi:MAG: transcriptional regulator [Pseudomonadota bacterium]
MNKNVPLDELSARLSPEAQARSEAEGQRLIEEFRTLQDLRKARHQTQVELARKLGQGQVSISRLEKRTDLLLSTLRNYVGAMGGKLSLVVEFPDRDPVVLEGLGGDDDPSGVTSPPA